MDDQTKDSIGLPLWDSRGTADFLGVRLGTLDKWAHYGTGPRFIKLGKHRRYRPEDVEAFLATRPTGGGRPLEDGAA